jgi:hypothetical protein
MTILLDWSITSLNEYQRCKDEQLKAEHCEDGLRQSHKLLVPERPAVCPECKAEKSFWSKGYYFRRAVDAEFEVVLPVPRYMCRFCRLVLSVLFAFLVPYRQFTSETISTGVRDYVEDEVSYRQEASLIAGDDNNRDEQRPNHSQLWRWVDLFCKKSANRLSVVVQRACIIAGKEDHLGKVSNSLCLNALKAHSIEKAQQLIAASKLLALAGILLEPRHNFVKAIQTYFVLFVQPASSILTGRGVRLITPQSSQHTIF